MVQLGLPNAPYTAPRYRFLPFFADFFLAGAGASAVTFASVCATAGAKTGGADGADAELLSGMFPLWIIA